MVTMTGTDEEVRALAAMAGVRPALPRTKHGLFDIVTGAHMTAAQHAILRNARWPGGRQQSNAEHSHDLAMICLRALAHRQLLDHGKVPVMCWCHDLKEVFGGDTPIYDAIRLMTKEIREAIGYQLLVVRELQQNPYVYETMSEYEEPEEVRNPEAVLVHAGDKFEPVHFGLNTDGYTYVHNGDDYERLVREQLPKTAGDPTIFDWMITGLRLTGEFWNDPWGCKPFEGDPVELIREVIREIVGERQMREAEHRRLVAHLTAAHRN